ncbi:MAG: prepilin-type N-terminal cleavage/methylation domain-containing protein [Caldiserica bacterium]|nr:prepilin-type N-terminal cleavage/methylation domain-containing protein [Caldisericota bacterium]
MDRKVMGYKWLVLRRNTKNSLLSPMSRFQEEGKTQNFLKGFTLIELMVVIAIVVLLAGIMIPNYIKNMEKAKLAKAKADIEILIKAITLYRVDSEEFPSSLTDLTSGTHPYLARDIPLSPWGGSYTYSLGTNSYTIEAKDSQGKVKYSETIKF